MISRELGHVSPERMLPDKLHPAASLDNLSPADRVFGWVNQNGKGAYKGQLRIHSIQCRESAVEEFNPPLPLAILGEPKEGQARFYVGKEDGSPLHQNADTGKTAYFEKTNPKKWIPRGKKVYPHQATTVSDEAKRVGYWDKVKAQAEAWKDPELEGSHAEHLGAPGAGYREYLRRLGVKRDSHGEIVNISNQDSQNRSIREWVKPGTEFTAVIDVVNLNIAELGVLLWLLRSAERCTFTGSAGASRLASAAPKSLSHASILQRAPQGLSDTESFFEDPDYSGLQGRHICVGGADRARELVADAFKAMKDENTDFERLPYVAAFLQSARGNRDDLPTHYPRTDPHPNPAGENFKWFGRNRIRPEACATRDPR